MFKNQEICPKSGYLSRRKFGSGTAIAGRSCSSRNENSFSFRDATYHEDRKSDGTMRATEYFIEKRPDGKYSVLKSNATRPSAIVGTQAEGIERAKRLNPEAAIHVERVKMVGDGRDKWRKV